MSKFIVDFESKDSINQPMFVKGVLKGATDKGSPYLTISFQDKSGSITSKLWNVTPEQEAIVSVGKVISVSGDVIEYNNALQLRVRGVDEVSEEVNMDDFVIRASISEAELKKQIEEAINSIKNDIYRNIIKSLYTLYGNDFYVYPAASKIHHSFVGGLAYHVISMVKLSDAICELYPQLNRDLLTAGILAHDLGKMVEFSGPITTEYTLEGKLIGHISIVHGQLMEIIKELDVEESEESLLLRHMVLSHHGHLEFGSPVVPLIQEAEVLYMIDNMDARLNTLDSLLKPIKPGTFSPKVFSLDNRSFYKPKGE